MDDAPHERAEEPLADPERQPDDEEERREDDQDDREGDERSDPADLAGDRL
jgi:hypothetical protein